MAQKTVYMELHGTVIEGDYKGLNVYRCDENSFIITKGRISRGPNADKWTTVKKISKKTVSRYQILASTNQNNSFMGMLHNKLVGGTADHQIAIYFQDGKKCIIKLFFDACFNDIQRILFVL